MQRTLRTLGLCTLALIAGGATLQKPEPAARIVDAATGKPIRQARTTTSRAERVIRAPGYQDVRIVTSAGPGAKHVPRGPREVALCKLGAADRTAMDCATPRSNAIAAPRTTRTRTAMRSLIESRSTAKRSPTAAHSTPRRTARARGTATCSCT